MGNWIDELDETTREYDRQVRAGAKQYDEELYNPQGGCCDEDGDEDEDEPEDETDEDDEDED